MLTATNIRMPPMQAIGTISSHRARKMASSSFSANLKIAGQRRDRADLDVRRRPRQRPGVREAVQQRHEHLHPALAPQFLVGVERHAPVVGEPVGHPRAEQALDAGHEHDRDDEVAQVPEHRRRQLDRARQREPQQVRRESRRTCPSPASSPTSDQTVAASSVASPSAISGAGMNFEIFSKYFVTTNVIAAIAIA